MNEANSSDECPSCHHRMGVEADYNMDGTGIVTMPARDESARCPECGTLVCIDCATADGCKLCQAEDAAEIA